MLEQRTILIVDDDASMVKLLAQILNENGYNVIGVNNGKDALNKLKEGPSLVLLDRQLPDMDGLEVCRKIRESKRNAYIPIIIVSSTTASETKVDGFYYGADAYMVKPFKTDELLARVKAVLRRSGFPFVDEKAREEIRTEVNRIIDSRDITAYFQTIYATVGGGPIGCEALSRPRTKGILLDPEMLFMAAFEFRLYLKLERLCWEIAVNDWMKLKGRDKLFLNCLPALIEYDLLNKNFFDSLKINPKDVAIEISERVKIKKYSKFLKSLKRIEELGARYVIDDVGSGYSSMELVTALLPHFIKIDVALIQNINNDKLKRSLVESIVKFCRQNKIKVIAEGVDNEEEMDAVSSLFVDYVQGYHLSQPQKA